MRTNTPIVLDCTIRDGGYYNNWDFPRDLVNTYIKSVDAAGVDVIEIGLRNFSLDGFQGPFAYSSDAYINSLNINTKAKLCVMIESKSLLSRTTEPAETINQLFQKKSKSPVSVVRIATHLENAKSCKPFCDRLKDLGYIVGLNLMQIAGSNYDQLNEIISDLATWSSIDVLYFADSFGNLTPESTTEIVTFLQKTWKGPLGIHAHNNKDLALSNTMIAQKLGVTWLDATITGMGRGAGNTKTELLLLELNANTETAYHPESLFPLVFDRFEPLQKQYGWGPNLLYFLSAIHSIHPSYVQFMTSEKELNSNRIMDVLNQIKSRTDRSSFKKQSLEDALYACYGAETEQGTFNATGFLKDREVLLLGAGPSRLEHKEAIKDFIKARQPYVISLNASNHEYFGEYIDAFAACHFSRIILDSDFYHRLSKPLIIPKNLVPNQILESLSKNALFDYGIVLGKNQLEWESSRCLIETPLTLGYALSFCNTANANKIFLCGFDGYAKSSDKQVEVEQLLSRYQEKPQKIEVLSLTPSTYRNLTCKSVYDPFI